MPFKIGDRVSFLNEKGEGVIASEERNGMVKVQIEDGFEIPYTVNELVLIGDNALPSEENIKKDNRIAHILQEDKIPVPSPQKRNTRGAEEIDLHIEELIDSHAGMTNAEIVRLQLSHFQSKLDEAIRKKKRKLIFIHGVGNGRLKEEIHKYLDQQEGMVYYDAPYHQYGFGATTVEIH